MSKILLLTISSFLLFACNPHDSRFNYYDHALQNNQNIMLEFKGMAPTYKNPFGKKQIFIGEYLGVKNVNGEDCYHYVFPNALKGKSRYLEIFLQTDTTKRIIRLKNYTIGQVKEVNSYTINDNNNKALLLLRYHHEYDAKEIESIKNKSLENTKYGKERYPSCLLGGVAWDNQLIFKNIKYSGGSWGWICETKIQNIERIKAQSDYL